MKKGIHPEKYVDAKVTCACGNSFATISTRKELSVEICSACHPFFTGKKRYIDTEGQIDKFAKRMQKSGEVKSESKNTKSKAQKAEEKEGKRSKPLTLKDLREMSSQES